MKTVARTTFALLSMAALALSQESRGDGQDRLLPLSLSSGFEGRDLRGVDTSSDVTRKPFSYSPEALRPAENEPSFSIGPAAGYLRARGADHGTWFGGVQARLHFARILAAEASITFHSNRYENGDVLVTQYPLQLTAFLYPIPDGPIRPYLLGGVGWYYTRIDYKDSLGFIDDQTEHFFGEHLGAGVDVMAGPRMSLDLDVRYIFVNATNEQVIRREFNYWQITLGLNLFF